MIFKFNSQFNRKRWEHIIKQSDRFGLTFPKEIKITPEDEKFAQDRVLFFEAIWNRDQDKILIDKIYKIYNYKFNGELVSYLTTTKTSGIDLKEKTAYLSVYLKDSKIPSVIIHEFSHIAFLDKYIDFCKELGYTDNGIQELKEVLTVINNFEFEGVKDNGYKPHAVLRDKIAKIWKGGKNIKDIISDPEIIESVNAFNTIK